MVRSVLRVRLGALRPGPGRGGAGGKKRLGVPLLAFHSLGEGDPQAVFCRADGGAQAVGEARHGKRALPGRPTWAWSASLSLGVRGEDP